MKVDTRVDCAPQSTSKAFENAPYDYKSLPKQTDATFSKALDILQQATVA